MREAGENPTSKDLSMEFLELSESEFFNCVNQPGLEFVYIKIPLSALAANVNINRLKLFLTQSKRDQKRHAVLQATRSEFDAYHERFEKIFPGIEWDVLE